MFTAKLLSSGIKCDKLHFGRKFDLVFTAVVGTVLFVLKLFSTSYVLRCGK
jgi:hypothetical protein